jgi:hypothetical protein
MEAIGRAANVLSCLQFASHIISRSRQIYNSAEGAALDVTSLMDVALNLSRTMMI